MVSRHLQFFTAIIHCISLKYEKIEYFENFVDYDSLILHLKKILKFLNIIWQAFSLSIAELP